MTAVKRGEMPIPLARMRERVAAWRATRAKGARIPDGVWKEAARLAATHGVSRTSTALGLAYYTLKKRVQGMPGVGSASASKPAFVELITPTTIPTSECLIEFEDRAGRQLRWHWKGCHGSEVVALSRLFLEAK